jgi:hypothetical protein
MLTDFVQVEIGVVWATVAAECKAAKITKLIVFIFGRAFFFIKDIGGLSFIHGGEGARCINSLITP